MTVEWEEVVFAQPGHRGRFQGVTEGDLGGPENCPGIGVRGDQR